MWNGVLAMSMKRKIGDSAVCASLRRVATLLALVSVSFVVSAIDSPMEGARDDAEASVLSLKHRALANGAQLLDAPKAELAYLDKYLEVRSARLNEKANQSSLTRAQVVNLYNTLFLPGNSASMGWTGSGTPTCNPGTTNASYRQATLDRVNFYRQVSGLPTITFFAPTDTIAVQTQAAALLQGSNSGLTHTPPTTSTCYSSNAATRSGQSNLAKGGAGPGAIDLYIDDSGGGNTSVGHRRWLLYPPMVQSYSGDASVSSSTNAFRAFGSGVHGSRPSMPNGVAWPPGGFVPYQVLPDVSNRWSFSWPGADFSAATVSIMKNGSPVAILGYDSRDNFGYGDASIVFRPNNVAANGPFVSYASPGGVDQDYVVTVSGIAGGGAPSSVTYTVTVIDPAAIPNVTIAGSATLATSGNVAAGTPLCANPSSNVTCSTIDANGQYLCSVPSGWTGTLHLQAGNDSRVAARRYTSGVTTVQIAQNFTVYPANMFACHLDIDNDGRFVASVDGVMLLRHMMGLTAATTTIPTTQACAQRTNQVEMATYLSQRNYDFDGNANGTSFAREGLVLVRLMLGLAGTQAVAGTGYSWSTVQSQINTACGTSF